MEPAGLTERFVAAFLDTVLVLFVQVALNLVISLTFGITGARVAMAVTALLGLAVAAVYYVLMESSKRRATLGKIAVGIEVTDADGFTLDFGEALWRHMWRLVSIMTLGIGFLMAGWSEQGLALHDRMSGTRVVLKEEVFEEEE
ncbi:MAG: RDD family protein, partial [bacterium]